VGGVIWPELSLAKDGMLTGAKVAEMLATGKKSLGELLKGIPLYYNEKTKIPADAQQKARMVAAVAAHARAKKLEVIDIDGVRVGLEDSWVIVRASGTEDYVRVFAESREPDKAKKLVQEYKSIAEKA